MKKYLSYNTEDLTISQSEWKKELTAKTESMMALGNGYLGLRSVDEEIEAYNKEDLLVNGVFNAADDNMVTEIANLADSIQQPIIVNGERFSLLPQDEYLKTLDIKHGTLNRVVTAKRGNAKFKITFDRFVSQDALNVYAQKITFELLEGSDVNVKFMPTINGQTTNNGTQHFKEGDKKRKTLESCQYCEQTNGGDIYVFHNMLINAKLNGKQLKGGNDNFVITMARRQVGFKINVDLNKGDTFVMEKLMSVNTTRDDSNDLFTEEQVRKNGDKLYDMLAKSNYDALLKKSNEKWKDIWSQFHIQIKGNNDNAKYDQLANLFGIFHMNSFVPKDNSNLGVGAKGLSGEGYQGHNFWDTEFFIMLNYLYTKPQIAKDMLIYRYKGLEGARAKAKEEKVRKEESNLEGAQYPWETAWPTDGEVCPYWGQADIETGKQEPVASRRQEIHVSADVAYAIDMYYQFTKDEQFMKDMGYEIIIDTAIYYTNRAEKQKDGSYEINDVMGPNEYKGNINNNAYINAFAKKNIELALEVIDKLTKEDKALYDKITKNIPYKIPVTLMKEVKEKLKQQLPNDKKIIAENDQFLQLPLVDVSPFAMRGDAGKLLFSTKEGHIRLCSQLVKQADVVLLTYMLPELYDREIIDANFDYYEPITTHDSSLSPTTYVIQAVELDKMEKAYELYKYSIDIDLGQNMHSCDAGIHSGSIAAIWQSTVFGYGGLRYTNRSLNIHPKLPKDWDGLEYKVMYQGVELNVDVSKDSFKIKTTKGKITINVKGEPTEIDSNWKEFK